jgi:hypothetical protein
MGERTRRSLFISVNKLAPRGESRLETNEKPMFHTRDNFSVHYNENTYHAQYRFGINTEAPVNTILSQGPRRDVPIKLVHGTTIKLGDANWGKSAEE